MVVDSIFESKNSLFYATAISSLFLFALFIKRLNLLCILDVHYFSSCVVNLMFINISRVLRPCFYISFFFFIYNARVLMSYVVSHFFLGGGGYALLLSSYLSFTVLYYWTGRGTVDRYPADLLLSTHVANEP